jgi:hypothetical protein
MKKALGRDKEPIREEESKKAKEKKTPKRIAEEVDDGEQEHKDFMQMGVPEESSDSDLKDQKSWRTFVLKQSLRSLENSHVLYRVCYISYFCLLCDLYKHR